jgi:hypothetical protein
MTNYLEKIINYFSKSHNKIKNRRDLIIIYSLNNEELYDLMKYEISLLKKMKRKYFNTNDIEDTGTYDFQFQLIDVELFEMTKKKTQNNEIISEVVDSSINIYVDILPGGTVDLPETEDITINLISDHEWGWEVEREIKDIIIAGITQKNIFLNNINSLENWEIYINYPETVD